MEKIIIRTPNWLGDCVMSIPVVRGIRKLFPQAELWLLSKSNLISFWQLLPEVDEILIYSGMNLSCIREIKKYCFNRAIVLPNSWSSSLFFYLTGIPNRRGYRIRGRGWMFTEPVSLVNDWYTQHQTDYYLGLSRDLEKAEPERVSKIEVSSWAKEQARELLVAAGWRPGGAIIGIHATASYGPAKCWLPERFRQLIEELQEKYNCWIFICGANNEKNKVEEVLVGIKDRKRILNLAGQTDISQLAGLQSLCRVFIANDSGPMHLAAAIGVPVVAVFGSTDSERTGPRGKSVIVKKDISCSPCLKRECSIGLKCMQQIAVAEVMQAVEKMW